MTKCEYEKCGINNANFNYKDKKGGRFCSKHKKDGMVDVVHNKCEDKDCESRSPKFNNDGEIKGRFCSKHKEDGMVNVLEKRICEDKDCKSQHPKFNNGGEIKGRYCKIHKKDDMVDVVHKKCDSDGCKQRPNFNNNGETTGRYCKKHKKDGMIDVVSKKCEFKDCNSICPSYNNDGETKGRLCKIHKQDGMIDVVHPRCLSTFCDTQVGAKYKGYCFHCYVHLFPDELISRNYKTKEKAVVDFIMKHFPDYDWICDKRIDGGCSRRRPDLLLDLGHCLLITEIDENGHNSYEDICENKRMMEISQDVGFRPIVLIRFNPDAYTDENGKHIQSCWKQSKKDKKLSIASVKKWNERLSVLKDTIIYWMKEGTAKTLHEVKLFYDDDK